MIAQGLAFFAFIWFTVKFIWPPLLRAIETRRKQIADGLAAGERGKQDLELAAKRAGEELHRAREQASEIISQAEKRGAGVFEEA
jgi:F-type H+-transporting ATPase subunit b